MARKTREEAERTRQSIIEAAGVVFCRDGLHGARLEDVAREAGISRGAVYWHFRDKEELLQALLREQPLPIERPPVSGIDLAQSWELLYRDLLATLSDDDLRQLPEILLHKSERTAAAAPVQERLAAAQERLGRHLRHALLQAVESGELARELDIEAAGELLRTCITGLLFECLQQPANLPERIAITLDSLLHLLRHPPQRLLRARE